MSKLANRKKRAAFVRDYDDYDDDDYEVVGTGAALCLIIRETKDWCAIHQKKLVSLRFSLR